MKFASARESEIYVLSIHGLKSGYSEQTVGLAIGISE